jgi:hypothetical protein
MENLVTTQRVTIVGLDIPFWDLMLLMIKLALAAFPAAVVLFFALSFAYLVALLLMK